MDNPALMKAAKSGALLPIYILDDETAGEAAMGGASRWWLYEALKDLDQQLEGHLRLYRGAAEDILPEVAKLYGASTISWTRCYEPWRTRRDRRISETLDQIGVTTIRLNGSLLWEPWEVLKKDGEPYRVFTPYYRKGCLQVEAPARPMTEKPDCRFCKAKAGDGALALNDLALVSPVGWHDMLEPHWDVSEQGAQKALSVFLEHGLDGYKAGRDFPARTNTSRLSPYLHWGQISPNQIWYALEGDAQMETCDAPDADIDHFRSELAWREFSYNLLYHNPELPRVALQSKFDGFEWVDDEAQLERWQKGATGIPIVDAGMRELWQTGYMHNRVRMIVASFLIKNLRIDWRKGEAWFWDTLVDADLASNSASWQWVAGCGADAAPYFRVFNPALQAEKFDPKGDYIRQYVPELARLPQKHLAKPWEAPEAVLSEAGVALGKDYPLPMVDLKKSRAAALEAYQALS
ncbi:deoxyribodipyrimidine photo-lyase [Cohaesibacter sp. ES.047]|nr:deoxyribodipyrimidine photo-lyase [Cohaesibacter sp. ES.047]